VSAPEALPAAGPAGSVAIGLCPADVVELAALRGRTHELELIAGRRGGTLPAAGRVAAAAGILMLCVRPERWLLVSSPAPAGASVALWNDACAGAAAAIDQSSGLTALHLSGPTARDVLARGCRLDLAPELFPQGHAAATVMAQVATILAALPSGMLILTPASTARHFSEWLAAAAQPFGLAPRADVTVGVLSGDYP
jgi:sarcosine oxidase, subunit gamma